MYSLILTLLLVIAHVRISHTAVKSTATLVCDTLATDRTVRQRYNGSYPPIDDVCRLATSLEGYLYVPGDQEFESAARSRNKWRVNTPQVVVRPLTTADVQKVVVFAQQFNIRPTVASSGHDFFGRSSGSDTIHINMDRMKNIDVIRDDPRSLTGVTGILEPAVILMKAYQQLDLYNLTAVGGWCPGVCAGGFLHGGGTGPFSRRHGYGSDNVIGATVVGADGTVMEVGVNEVTSTTVDGEVSVAEDPELLRAIRGGIGGTYGIITQYLYQLYPTPTVIWYTVYVPMWDEQGQEVGPITINKFAEFFRQHESDTNLHGLFSTHDQNRTGTKGLIRMFFFYFDDVNYGESLIQPLVDELKPYLVKSMPKTKKVYTSYAKFANILDSHYKNDWIFPISRFIQPKDFIPGEDGHVPLVKAVRSFFEHNIWMCSFSMNGGLAKTHPHAQHTTIGPGFRSSEMIALCFAQDYSEGTVSRMKAFAQDLYTLGEGVYPNESQYDLVDWKIENWGSLENYQRLLTVKQRYDPTGLFTCYRCVGSEESDREFRKVVMDPSLLTREDMKLNHSTEL